MNVNFLRRVPRWAEKIAAAMRQLADETAAELAAVESSRDPPGEVIIDARKRFRQPSQSDRSKSGKSIDRELDRSYVEAMNAGFKGSFPLWMSIMRMGKSPEELAHRSGVSYVGQW